MSYEIVTDDPDREDGVYVDGLRVFVDISGGRLTAMIRSQDEATFWAQAQAVGLIRHRDPGAPAITDPETGEVLVPAVEPSGPLVPVPGVTIRKPYVWLYQVTPGEYGLDGEEITPPTYDPRPHTTFWMSPEVVERGAWCDWAWAWTVLGSPGTPIREEVSLQYGGVELIDPKTVRGASDRM